MKCVCQLMQTEHNMFVVSIEMWIFHPKKLVEKSLLNLVKVESFLEEARCWSSVFLCMWNLSHRSENDDFGKQQIANHENNLFSRIFRMIFVDCRNCNHVLGDFNTIPVIVKHRMKSQLMKLAQKLRLCLFNNLYIQIC